MLALDNAHKKVTSAIEFGEHLWSKSDGALRPRMHQIARIYEAVRNGRKRIIMEDTTSGGKTFTAVAIKGLLDEKYLDQYKRKARCLVIGPRQALHEAWDQEEIDAYTAALGLPKQRTLLLDRNTIGGIDDADLIYLNFEKLSIDADPEQNRYLKAVLDTMQGIDAVIVDEAHNLKSISTNRTAAFNKIIERSRQKHFMILTASAIPNKLEDAGYMLYMLDPVRFQHYGTHRFDYIDDQFSVWNARRSGAWFEFGRDDLKALYNLGELRTGAPELGIDAQHRFALSDAAAREYFERWRMETPNVSKVPALSQTLLRSEIPEIARIVRGIKAHEPDAQVGIFSFFKEGFSHELRDLLIAQGLRAATITGDERLEERLSNAARFRANELDVCVNTLSTVSESISLSTGERPCYVIFAEPPIVPANYQQAIGRFYRNGQHAPVTVIEMVPQSAELNGWMEEEVEQRKREGIRFRKTWRAGTVFEDKCAMRPQKERAIMLMKNAAPLGDISIIAGADEEGGDDGAYSSLARVTPTSTNHQFNENIKKVRSYIGKPVEDLAASQHRYSLIEGYATEQWDETSSADTNLAIAKVIETIEKRTGRRLESILDWGCGTACLARKTGRKVHNLDIMDEMLDIGRLRAAHIYGDEADKYFHQGNARSMEDFADGSLDLVSSAYALQYNAQGYRHRRDVEEILLQTNRVLKDEGYGIFALANQVTTQDDIKALTTLLGEYGFDVLASEYVTGHATNTETNRENKVFNGFYLILYQKLEPRMALSGPDDIFMHSPYKRLGVGGIRECELLVKPTKAYKSSAIPASTFRTTDKTPLEEMIGNALR